MEEVEVMSCFFFIFEMGIVIYGAFCLNLKRVCLWEESTRPLF